MTLEELKAHLRTNPEYVIAEVESLRAERDQLRSENEKLRAVASTGATLIRGLQAALEAQYDPEHPIRISRREMMDLPLDTRRRVMERMAEQFMSQNVGQSNEAPNTLDSVQDVDATATERAQEGE